MKRFIIIFFSSACLLSLVTYAFGGFRYIPASGGSGYAAVQTGCLRDELEPLDAAALRRLVTNGLWTERTTDCAYSCIILFGETGPALYYNHELGVINDFAQGRSLTLSAARRENVNSIIGRYSELWQGRGDISSFFTFMN